MKEKLEEYLNVIGFTKEEAQNILSQVETEIDVNELHKKLNLLIENGINKNVIQIILDENFLFLITDFEVIEQNMNVLKVLLDKKELVNAIELSPELITLSEGVLEKNIVFLNSVLGGKEALKEELINNGELFLYNPEYLEKNYENIINGDTDEEY